jgi:hypothetical protein
MKNQNNVFTAIVIALAFALAPMVGADEGSGPDLTSPPDGPAVTIHSTDSVTRGHTSAFVLNMKSAGIQPEAMLGGMYVKFSVGGTAIPGVDYVALVSPAHIGRSGYAVLLVKALPDPRGLSVRKAYSVVVKLEDSAGYTLGQPNSATMWIKP